FVQGSKYGRYTRYYAVVRSWLWFLTRTTDCRIFQEMTVPDIVKKVFGDHSTADFKFELTGSYRKWTYCVQYRETDFNFVSRLLEHEGIYFYTRHTDGHNTVVLTDSTSKHAPTPGYEKVSFIAPEDLVRPEIEHIGSWDFSRDIQPGVYVHDDYDLERPSVELRTRKTLTRTYSPSDYEIYDYPGHYIQKPDGEQYAHVRIDEFGTLFETSEGTSNSKGIEVGALFTLEDFPREDQNREYLVVGASYDLQFGDYEALPQSGGGTEYRCSFVAMPSSQQFRPRRATPKPFVQGPQTAVVVGPAGDEIYTDKYGRVKVQFHWDRYGKKDENSSCWIRVSHPWAGKSWGAVATPRIGQEVIVDFLEGDPDQPIITGRVYNAEQLPPFGFPAGAVLSGMKSQTHKGSGSNEMSMDDTAGKERVYVHGQFNMDTVVENNQTSTIHNNRTDTVDVNDTESVGSNQKCTVGANQDISVGSNQTVKVAANRTRTVGANESVTVGSSQSISVGSTKTETIAIAKALSIGAGYQVSVGAGMNESIGAAKAEEIGGAKIVSVGGLSAEVIGSMKAVKAGGSISESAGANIGMKAAANVAMNAGAKFTADAGATMGLTAAGDLSASSKAKVVIDAASEMVLKCGGASITLKSGGEITIKGTEITIKGSDIKVDGSSVGLKASGDVVVKGSSIKHN
ncbi:MAG TPA: type VI secretion system tip protein TssI/VgrG, partial [Vicinamibacterales bacterium]|nr:type VI secretion system tip protein TssI/VgrG [Vicinamibacterales bacterium]